MEEESDRKGRNDDVHVDDQHALDGVPMDVAKDAYFKVAKSDLWSEREGEEDRTMISDHSRWCYPRESAGVAPFPVLIRN